MTRCLTPLVRRAARWAAVLASVASIFVVGLVPVSAQLFGVVFDPTNYSNALLRYAQLERMGPCATLVTIGLLHPATDRPRCRTELSRQIGQRSPGSMQLDHLVPELFRISLCEL